jgi:hypothetical protein
MQDAFSTALGNRRGDITLSAEDGALLAGKGEGSLRRLLASIQEDNYGPALQLLGLATDPEHEESRWPPEDLKQRQEARRRQRSWMKTPSDEEAEIAYDGVDYLRRAVAERLGQDVLQQWLPTLRTISHDIGVRTPFADHVIEVEGIVHLWSVPDSSLLGSRSHTSTCLCGERTLQAFAEGKTRKLPRGYWHMHYYGDNDIQFCRRCQWTSKAYIKQELSETSEYLPLGADHWQYILPQRAIYNYLRKTPRPVLEEMTAAAYGEVRHTYINLAVTEAERSDKPCKWYRASALSEEDAWRVRQLTYDNRIGTPIHMLLHELIPQTPQLPDHWAHDFSQRLLDVLETRRKALYGELVSRVSYVRWPDWVIENTKAVNTSWQTYLENMTTRAALENKLHATGWTTLTIHGKTVYNKPGHESNLEMHSAALSQIHEEYLRSHGWNYSTSWRRPEDESSFSAVAGAMRRQAALDGFDALAIQKRREKYLQQHGWTFNGHTWHNAVDGSSFSNIKFACQRQESGDWANAQQLAA